MKPSLAWSANLSVTSGQFSRKSALRVPPTGADYMDNGTSGQFGRKPAIQVPPTGADHMGQWHALLAPPGIQRYASPLLERVPHMAV